MVRGARLAWLVVGCALPLTAIAVAVAVGDGLTWRAFVTGDPGFSAVLAVTFPLLGVAVLHRESGSRLAWVFSAVGLSRAVFVAATVWSDHTYVVAPGSWPGGGFASWVAFWGRLPAVALAPLVLLWFPDGRPPGRRWRAAAIPSGVALAAVVLLAVLSWPYRGPRLLPDAPVPPGTGAQIGAACFPVIAVAGLTGLAAALAALVSRLRAGPPIIRQQVKWYLYGGVAAIALNLSGDVLG